MEFRQRKGEELSIFLIRIMARLIPELSDPELGAFKHWAWNLAEAYLDQREKK